MAINKSHYRNEHVQSNSASMFKKKMVDRWGKKPRFPKDQRPVIIWCSCKCNLERDIHFQIQPLISVDDCLLWNCTNWRWEKSNYLFKLISFSRWAPGATLSPSNVLSNVIYSLIIIFFLIPVSSIKWTFPIICCCCCCS